LGLDIAFSIKLFSALGYVPQCNEAILDSSSACDLVGDQGTGLIVYLGDFDNGGFGFFGTCFKTTHRHAFQIDDNGLWQAQDQIFLLRGI
jgi:hypothetical protein